MNQLHKSVLERYLNMFMYLKLSIFPTDSDLISAVWSLPVWIYERTLYEGLWRDLPKQDTKWSRVIYKMYQWLYPNA